MFIVTEYAALIYALDTSRRIGYIFFKHTRKLICAKTIIYSIKTRVSTKTHTGTGMPSVDRVLPSQWQFSAIRIHCMISANVL